MVIADALHLRTADPDDLSERMAKGTAIRLVLLVPALVGLYRFFRPARQALR